MTPHSSPFTPYSSQIITRFAPSPTGLLHLGNVRTALLNWLYARKHGGHFLLRFEDTDQDRSEAEYIEAIQNDLNWLGLDWDGDALFQSAHAGRHAEALEVLANQGWAYRCFCSEHQLTLDRKLVTARGLPPRYAGRCRGLLADESANRAEQESFVWRMAVHDDQGEVQVFDALRGDVDFALRDLDDPVIVRSDGSFTFLLPNAVDDVLDGVTHALRGDDHLTNSAYQVWLLQRLGYKPPAYMHHGLLLGADGAKLSKRSGSHSVADLREDGLLPAALVQAMSRLGHPNMPGDSLDIRRLLVHFEAGRISTTAVRWSDDEMWRWHTRLLHALPAEQLAALIKPHLPDTDAIRLNAMAALIGGNLERVEDAAAFRRLLDVKAQVGDDEQVVLNEAGEAFFSIAEKAWLAHGSDDWKDWLNTVRLESGCKGKALFMPLRVVLSGALHGPEMSAVIEFLGRDGVAERLRQAGMAQCRVSTDAERHVSMSLVVYNAIRREKEVFKPRQPGHVGMYVCGVTVYDYSHVGHARVMIVFDVMYRWLMQQGYDVDYIRNFTDVDDKIIIRAAEHGISIETLTDEMIAAFHADADALGCLRPTHEPRATQHMDAMVRMIQALMDKGMAYVADSGDVLYAVRKFADYGKLSGKKIDELESGSRVDVDHSKRDPLDFVLWKRAKVNEPAWESPWGAGRPGWHIECSAMSCAHLGSDFDIHGGGMDLKFPHHENEIAQAQAANGGGFARYWLHNSFVNINAEKMSKSLGNFFTIREVSERYDPEVLRMFMLGTHYRSPLDFSDTALDAARASLDRLYETSRRLRAVSEQPGVRGEESGVSGKATGVPPHTSLPADFTQAMNDDFNTPEALAVLFDCSRALNKELNDSEEVSELASQFTAMTALLAIVQQDVDGWFHSADVDASAIEVLIGERLQARKACDFARADAIRNELSAQGIALEDSASGTTWKKM